MSHAPITRTPQGTLPDIGRTSRQIRAYVEAVKRDREVQLAVRREYQRDISMLGPTRQASASSIQSSFSAPESLVDSTELGVVRECVQRLNPKLWPEGEANIAAASYGELTKALQDAHNMGKQLPRPADKQKWAKTAGMLDRASTKAWLVEMSKMAQAHERKAVSTMQKANAVETQAASQALLKFASETENGTSCEPLARLMCVAELHGDPAQVIARLQSLKDPTVEADEKKAFHAALRQAHQPVPDAGAGDQNVREPVLELTVPNESLIGSWFRGSERPTTTQTIKAAPTGDALGVQFRVSTIVDSLALTDAPVFYAMTRTPSSATEGPGHTVLIGKKQAGGKDQYVFYDPNFGRRSFVRRKDLANYVDQHMKRVRRLVGSSHFYNGKTFALERYEIDRLKVSMDTAGVPYGQPNELERALEEMSV